MNIAPLLALAARTAVAVDGDSLMVAGREIRLAGMDALEWNQTCTDDGARAWPCGAAAKAALVSLVAGSASCGCEKAFLSGLS